MKKCWICALLAVSLVGCGSKCEEVKCDCACPEAAAAEAKAEAQVDAAKAADQADTAKPEIAEAIVPGAEEIVLPKYAAVDVSLTKTLEKRRSIRAYTDKMPSLQDVSNLLWSANGINREDGKRTAPSARNKQSVTLFVAFENSAYRYDHTAHKLVRLSETDIRTVKDAPMELIFTSNHVGAPEDTTPEKQQFNALIRGIDAGVVSENAALYCAAVDLATVIRMYRDRNPEIVEALKLTDADALLFNMAVGYEKK